jgi:RND family efflux transporter MFP subunit
MPLRRWKTRILLPLAPCVVFAGLLAYVLRDAFRPTVNVRVVPVMLKSGSGGAVSGGGVVVQAPGWVEADPFFVAVPALTDGVIRDVFVLEGDKVAAGQITAKLVDDDAKLALARAEAELRMRKAELARVESVLKAARREWENPVERERNRATAEARLTEAQAQWRQWDAEIVVEAARLDEFRDRLKRVESLSSDAVSDEEIVRTKLQLRTQEAVLQALKARQPVFAAQTAQYAAEAQAARENLRLRIAETRELEEAEKMFEQAQAALALAEAVRAEAALRLERTEIRAPTPGVVQQRLAFPGGKVMQSGEDPYSGHVFHLYDPAKLQVRTDVPLADAAGIFIGQKALVVVEVLPDRTFGGEVVRIVHSADIAKNTLQAKVAIQTPSSELKPEMLARVRFLAPEKKTGANETPSLFALESALRQPHPGHFTAWVVNPKNNTVEERTVKLADLRENGWVAVIEGLNPGDRLIVGDVTGLSAGAKVRVTDEAP